MSGVKGRKGNGAMMYFNFKNKKVITERIIID